TYDGSPDSRSFHQFLTEGTAYVKDGWVEPRRRVFILAHYLKGRAREFYTREVSGDPYHWRLKGFFTELFNYCFPINFWMKHIQTELWKKELNPESSSFQDVKIAAEIIEIAHSVPTGGRDRCSKDKALKGDTTAGETQKTQKEDALGQSNRHDRRRGNDRSRQRDGPSKQEGTSKNAESSKSQRAEGGRPRNSPRSRQMDRLSATERKQHVAEGLCYVQDLPTDGGSHTADGCQWKRKGYSPLRGNPGRGVRPGTMGDPLAERAEEILQRGAYLGDDLACPWDPQRFYLGTRKGYSARQIQAHSQEMEHLYPGNGRQAMGMALAERVAVILSAYGPYPLDPEDYDSRILGLRWQH
ncbi:hypothetical protein K503DRAFT_788194, partial [Rhizopogon vinicolor AM-OR11-026]